MPASAEEQKKAGGTIRTSVSFPESTHLELERLAAANKVSLAWIVRQAVEKYLAERWPLFPKE
jgi:hypothetical protein